jgi:hypothetical protein
MKKNVNLLLKYMLSFGILLCLGTGTAFAQYGEVGDDFWDNWDGTDYDSDEVIVPSNNDIDNYCPGGYYDECGECDGYGTSCSGGDSGVSSGGSDCDDTRSCVKDDCEKVDWYYDGDGYYAQIKNDYKTCKPEGDKWNETSNIGIDCDDDEILRPLLLICLTPDPCDFDDSDTTDASEAALAAVNGEFTCSQAACNIGVNHAFEELTCNDDFDGLLANDIMDDLGDSDDWEEIEMNESQAFANGGDIVVTGTTNSSGTGHLVMIVPGTEVSSGSWEGNVPVAMDTGPNKKWSSKGINYSWSSSSKDDVQFFKYTGDSSCDPNNNCE